MQWIYSLQPHLFYLLPLLSFIPLLLLFFISPQKNIKLFRFQNTLLILLAIISFANYHNMGRPYDPKWPSYLNRWEFFHYYMGSKYAEEVGYYHLYSAALIADNESGQHYKNRSIRDLKTSTFVSIDKVLRLEEYYKSSFTPTRWQEFVADIKLFKKHLLPLNKWHKVLQDKGYNATPAWSMVVGFISNQMPLSSEWGIAFLSYLDIILLLFGLSAVWWAFGRQSFLFLVLLLGAHVAMNHSHFKGAYLRIDWFIFLLVAICCLKKEYYKTAGILTAGAALSRIFPLIFSFGIFALFCHHWLKTKKFHSQYTQYLLAFFATLLIVLLLSFFSFGQDYFEEYLAKISAHDHNISLLRVGFKMVFLGTYEKVEYGNKNYITAFKERQIIWWLLQLSMLILSFFAVRKLKAEEAQSFCFVPCYFLFTPTYYYYILLLIPMLFFTMNLPQKRAIIGIGIIQINALLIYYYHDYLNYKCQVPTWYVFSLALFILSLYMMFISLCSKAALSPSNNLSPQSQKTS